LNVMKNSPYTRGETWAIRPDNHNLGDGGSDAGHPSAIPPASLGATAKLGRLSQKAREVAHPQLFRFNVSNPRYAFRVNRAHPPYRLLYESTIVSLTSRW
jgi:hypothetical protein